MHKDVGAVELTGRTGINEKHDISNMSPIRSKTYN